MESYVYGVEGIGYLSKRVPDCKDTESIQMYHIRQMYKKTQSMFKYENLPDTIKQRWLELQLQVNGYTTFFKNKDNKIYCSFGQLGGIPSYDYLPTISIVNNPYLKFNEQLKIDEDCVIVRNDSLYDGLLPINTYYANKLAVNNISRRVLLINLRAMLILNAKDDNDRKDCEDFIKALENGDLKVIQSHGFGSGAGSKIDNLASSFGVSSQTIIQIIEDEQYVKGSWLNELGVQSNYNMKRETITSNENILNVDGLLPLIDDMLNCRKEDIEKVNKMFGTNIKVELNSAWRKVRTEISISEERQKQEVANLNQSNQLDNTNKEGDDNDRQVEN